MRKLILILGAMLALGCNEDGGSDSNPADRDSLVVESARLTADRFGDCQVQGSVLNTDGETTCDGCPEFAAFNSSGTVIDHALDCVQDVAPNSRRTYVASFIDLPCSQIARFEQSDLTQFCD